MLLVCYALLYVVALCVKMRYVILSITRLLTDSLIQRFSAWRIVDRKASAEVMTKSRMWFLLWTGKVRQSTAEWRG